LHLWGCVSYSFGRSLRLCWCLRDCRAVMFQRKREALPQRPTRFRTVASANHLRRMRSLPQHPPVLTVGTLLNLLTPVKAAGTWLIPVAAPLMVLPVTVGGGAQLNSIPTLFLVMALLFMVAPGAANK